MTDLYGYMHPVYKDGVSNIVITLRSEDGSIAAGGRFKYIQKEIGTDYQDLVNALNQAIDKEAEVKGSNLVTNEREVTVKTDLDYDNLMNKFNGIIEKLIDSTNQEEFQTKWSPRIVQITERYLGKGKKVSQCTRDQVEMLSLIVADLEELL